ncbi:hypothetical protein SteCoe_22877 [Stentor coeruleus]|uniref:Cyclic nucleotide-binding domain-containing protein n=1 Tax=Stentor coeruleus TaxID=5963 RepID=A0A1R2BL96_9CILI|nr:hypothetical protein SteCoe_22877 [Stentor coeruleus]
MNTLSSQFTKNLINIFSVSPSQRSQHDLEEIMKVTKDIKFLKNLSEERNSDRVHWECCRVMTLEIFNPGDNIINYGEPGDKYYIIIKGKVSVLVPSMIRKKPISTPSPSSKSLKKPLSLSIPPLKHEPHPDDELEKSPYLKPKQSNHDIDFIENSYDFSDLKELKILTDGDSFGELALLSNNPRSATVKCKEVSYFAVLSQKDYKKILRTDAQKSIHDRIEYLYRLPMFNGASHTALKNLAFMMTECTFRKKQILYTEGSPAEYICFIKSGEFKLTVNEQIKIPNSYKETSLLKLKLMKNKNRKVNFQVVIKGKGEMFGQEELVEDQSKRSRTCTCESTFGQVYMVYINDVKNRPACQMMINYIKEKNNIENERNSNRLETLRTVENLKHKTATKKEKIKFSENIQNILYTINQKIHPPYYVTPQHTNKIKEPFVNKSNIFHNRQRIASDSHLGSDTTRSIRMSASQVSIKTIEDGVFENSYFVKSILKKSGISGFFKENYNKDSESPVGMRIRHFRNKTHRIA